MIPYIGIDLGTTFSCVSYIDDEGQSQVIKNTDNEQSTPSVIWFDGKVAYVGKKANDRKLQANSPIFEFVKRDLGKDNKDRYKLNGFDYGACGMSAIILKKLKQDAFYFYKRKGWLSQDNSVQNLIIPAVITVPAYFGDKQRSETKMAGIAAGIDVIAIINEPTAAALTYGFSLNQKTKILVFDLGGGTFDVTILDIGSGEAKVIASDGLDELGGKDWDVLLTNYFFSEFERQTGKEVPDDMTWEVQRLAIESKYYLTDQYQTTVYLNAADSAAEIVLYRERPESDDDDLIVEDNKFYFEERSQNLLSACKAILNKILEKTNLTWNDIDDIVLVGGSSQMPMISKMLAKVSGKAAKKNITGFSMETAIAQGAALYGRNKEKVVDVSSKSVGIEVKQANKPLIEHLIKKNTPLPISISQTFPAEANAILKVYEGDDSTNPDECEQRGRLELGNAAGNVTIGLSIDVSGSIRATVEASGVRAELKIKSDSADTNIVELNEKIKAVEIRM